MRGFKLHRGTRVRCLRNMLLIFMALYMMEYIVQLSICQHGAMYSNFHACNFVVQSVNCLEVLEQFVVLQN